MPERKFDLGDYVEVKDRLAIFYERYGKGSIVTTDVRLTTEPDGVPRVLVEAKAYRTPDDPQPGVGWSWMVLPGTTSYTKGSELENTETSAWGRAIASLGILVDKSIASAQEIQNKDEPIPDKRSGDETLELLGRIQKSGKAMKGGSERYKVEWHDTPAGPVIGFKLKLDGEDRDIPQVLVMGGIAASLRIAHPEDLTGMRLTIKGHLYNVKQQGRTAYYRLVVGERPEDFIETPEVRIPPLPDPEQEVVDAIPVAEGQEALFDAAESARLDAEAAAEG